LYTDFEDLNLYVYNSAHGALLDGVIWCLGPYVDRQARYGPFRLCLAWATRTILRRCYLRGVER
jgi:hypothetical protein